MCGRFAQIFPVEEIQRHFPIDHITCDLVPRQEIFPTQEVPAVIIHNSETRLGLLYWGLIPRWSKQKPKRAIINARVETLSQKPSFRDSFQYRRCLVVADGYYEWKKSEDDWKKTKYFFQLPSKAPFAFAGLWDTWNKEHHSCTVITQNAVDSIKEVHHRMPLILNPSIYRKWLDPRNNEPEYLYDLLSNNSIEDLSFHEVMS